MMRSRQLSQGKAPGSQPCTSFLNKLIGYRPGAWQGRELMYIFRQLVDVFRRGGVLRFKVTSRSFFHFHFANVKSFLSPKNNCRLEFGQRNLKEPIPGTFLPASTFDADTIGSRPGLLARRIFPRVYHQFFPLQCPSIQVR